MFPTVKKSTFGAHVMRPSLGLLVGITGSQSNPMFKNPGGADGGFSGLEDGGRMECMVDTLG